MVLSQVREVNAADGRADGFAVECASVGVE